MDNKKKRSENWSNEEKDLLRQLIAASAYIIENKQNKASINLQKAQEWKYISKRLNEITNKNRSESEVKLAWKRMKLAAKANLSLHRRQTSQTGGGEKPPSPSQEDQEIMAIAPHDFLVEQNVYDSDGAHAIEIVASEDVTDSADVHPTTSHVEIEIKNIYENKENIGSNTLLPSTSNLKSKKKKISVINKNNTDAIIESNLKTKKRNLEMMEEMHALNKRKTELEIQKLELEIKHLQEK